MPPVSALSSSSSYQNPAELAADLVPKKEDSSDDRPFFPPGASQDLPIRKRKLKEEGAGTGTAPKRRSLPPVQQHVSPPLTPLPTTPSGALVDVWPGGEAVAAGVEAPRTASAKGATPSRTTRAAARNPHAEALFVDDYREGRQARDIAAFIDSLDEASYEALWPGEKKEPFLDPDGTVKYLLPEHLKVFVARDRKTDEVIGLAWYENSTASIAPGHYDPAGIPRHQIIETSMVVHQDHRDKQIGKLLTEERFKRIVLKKDDEEHRYMLSKIFDFNKAQLKRRRATKEYVEIRPQVIKRADGPDRILHRFVRDLENKSHRLPYDLDQVMREVIGAGIASPGTDEPKEPRRAITRTAKKNAVADADFVGDYAKGETAVEIARFMDSVSDEVYGALMGSDEPRRKWLTKQGKAGTKLPDGLKLFAARGKDGGIVGLCWYRKSRQAIPAGEFGAAAIPKDRIIETAMIVHQDAKANDVEALLTETRFQRIVLKKDDEHFRYILSCVFDDNAQKLAERRGMPEYVELPSRGDGLQRFLFDLDNKRR